MHIDNDSVSSNFIDCNSAKTKKTTFPWVDVVLITTVVALAILAYVSGNRMGMFGKMGMGRTVTALISLSATGATGLVLMAEIIYRIVVCCKKPDRDAELWEYITYDANEGVQ